MLCNRLPRLVSISFALAIILFFSSAALAQVSTTLIGKLGDDFGEKGELNPGDVIEFYVTIENNSASPLTGVEYLDALDPNTTLIGTEGIARDDSYVLVGSGDISVPADAGVVLTNDFGNGLQVTGYDAQSERGSSVSVQADGSFTYSSNGYHGKDSFEYTITDGFGKSTSATVTLFVHARLWFVDNSFGGSSDGSAIAPFKSLLEVKNASSTGDAIFIAKGSGAPYDHGLFLKENQSLLGQSSLLQVFDQEKGKLFELPTASASNRPLLIDTDVTDTGTALILGGNNAVKGLRIGALSASRIQVKGLYGSDFGSLYLREVAFANSNSYMIDLRNGAVDAIVDSISNPNSFEAAFVNLDTCSGRFEVTGRVSGNQGLSIGNGSVDALFHDLKMVDPHYGIHFVGNTSGSLTIESKGGGIEYSSPSEQTAISVSDAANFSLKGTGGSPFRILNVAHGSAGSEEAAIYVGNSTQVKFENIELESGAVEGDSGFSLVDSTEFTLMNSKITVQYGDAFQIRNLASPSDSSVTIQDNYFAGTPSFGSNSYHGILGFWQGSTALNVAIIGNRIDGARNAAMRFSFAGTTGRGSSRNTITIDNNKMFDTYSDAIVVEGQDSSKIRATITNNQLDGLVSYPLASRGGPLTPLRGVHIRPYESSEMDVVVQDNFFRDFQREPITMETRLSPFNSILRALIDGNQITQQSVLTSQPGIEVNVAGVSGSDRVDATISNNTVFVDGYPIAVGNYSGASSQICVDISGTSGDGGTAPPPGNIRLVNSGTGKFLSVGGVNISPQNNSGIISVSGTIQSTSSCAAVQ